MKRYFDQKGIALRTTLSLGYSPISELILPNERVEKRIYRKQEDFIPFLLMPIYEERVKYDRYTAEITERRRTVTGVSNNPIYIDFSQGGGLLLFVSPTGAGKTFALRGLIGDLIENGYACFIVDVKNEFISSLKPLQEKFWNLIPPWRKPKSLPIKPLFPAYLGKKKIPKEWICQIDVKDMEVEDMLTCLNLEHNDAQAQILLTVWREENNPKSIDTLMGRVSQVNASQILANLVPEGVKLQPFAERTQGTLIRKLILLKSQNVFGSSHNFNVADMLTDGQVPVLCLNEDDRKKYWHSTYIAVIVRKIYESCRRIGRRIVFVFEDMGSFAMPNKANPSCKDVILKQLIPVGRKRGLYIIGAIQNLSQLPEEAVAQAKTFIFFGRVSGLDLERISKIRKVRYKVVREKMQEYFRYSELSNGMRGAIIWDEKTQGKLGFVGAPSSCHAEQER